MEVKKKLLLCPYHLILMSSLNVAYADSVLIKVLCNVWHSLELTHFLWHLHCHEFIFILIVTSNYHSNDLKHFRDDPLSPFKYSVTCILKEHIFSLSFEEFNLALN